ncbi:ComEC/Rec2 family competence protein [Cohnella sp. REN36]|uniref:ComEC/Rec2 family competence protein n=1 Tax=Cohnella sp. REN36 TaxID=2887347 RepID=UPI001D13FBD3|nr:ComEC/Rec2 family competence protein [Cohnella sp. REN36]MCC3375655.1 ComEC/Rec2 family competence protein [Cohnella sp. REN36]
MRRRPLVGFAACWVAGSGVQSLWHGPAALLIYAGLAVGMAALALAGRWPWRLCLACALALMLAAGHRAWVDAGNQSQMQEALGGDPDGRAVTMTGTIASAVDIDGDIVQFRLSIVGIDAGEPGEGAAREVRETVLVRVRLAAEEELGPASAWRRGDTVGVRGEIKVPAEGGNFGGFDYRAYLRRQQVHWTVSAKGAEAVSPKDGSVDLRYRVLRAVDEARLRIGGLMDRLYGSTDTGYMKGLVAGIRDDVDPGQYDDFSRLGLTHVLAISGLHVGVVVFLLLRVGAWLRLTRERSLEVAIAAMPVYMLLTGASPSAVRACLMSMIALYLARRRRLKDGLHLLAAAAWIMTVWNPLVVEDVSFQLSFLVTAGLLLYVPLLARLLRFVPASLRSGLAVALTAQVASFPLTAYYFHQLHLLSLLANLLLVPFISFLVLPLGMASVALGACWLPLGIAPARLAELCNRATFAVTEAMSGVRSLSTVWPQPSLAWVFVAYGLIACTGALLRHRLDRREERSRLEAELQGARALADLDPARRAQEVPAYAAGGKAGSDTGPLPASSITARAGTQSLGVYPPASPATGISPTDLWASGSRSDRVRQAALALLTVFAWIGWLVWGAQPAAFDRSARVMFLDVGQGDSILVRTGEGKHLLVDAGGTVAFGQRNEAWRRRRDPYEVGRKTLVPLLKQRGVRKLDLLVLTHLDADHIGGAEALIREIEIGRILFNGTMKPTPDVLRLFQLAIQKGIPLYAAEHGMRWRTGPSAELKVLYPEDVGGKAASGGTLPAVAEQNDRSVVLLLSLYGRTFVLPGDLEAAGEAEVLVRLREEAATAGPGGSAALPAPIDVLKAGHHGSKTSTTDAWLAWWRPAEVVVSVGANNLYGHPNPGVVARIKALPARLSRTDANGEIQYRIAPDGRLSRREKRPWDK